jgi:hypothetical protein
MTEANSHILGLRADMGGTELREALEATVKSRIARGDFTTQIVLSPMLKCGRCRKHSTLWTTHAGT